MYKVMIVDDESTFRLGLKKLINWESFGFQVCCDASNGQEAWELQQQYHTDLIITDIKMPVMDGIELTKRLVDAKDPAEIIIVSAYGEFEFAQKVMQFGVRYYLLKPISETILEGYLSKIAEDRTTDTVEQVIVPDSTHFDHLYKISTNGIIPELRRYIGDHFAEPLSLNFLGSLYSFSPVYLGRLFKKETGVTFNEYLNKCRVSAACLYLKQGNKSIREISELVGYKDINYFYKCFKSITGKTPREYE